MLISTKTLLFSSKEYLLDTLFRENPRLKELLITSTTLEDARRRITNYINELELVIRDETDDPLVRAQAIWAANTLKNIFSRSSEKLVGFSTLEILMKLAKNPEEKEKVHADFILEFIHLFRALRGEADIYPAKFAENLGYFDFSKIKGRKAGIERSNYLDRLEKRIESYLERYPTGLDKDVIERRLRHKKQILERLGGTYDDWDDYVWHFRNIIKTRERIELIKDIVGLTDTEVTNMEMALKYMVPFGITPYYLSLMDPEFPWKYDYQIRAQVIPPTKYVKKMIAHRHDREYYFDFMGEHDTSPEDLITRRYPMIAILKASDTCPQICVYCQRNWEIQEALAEGGIPPRQQVDKAIEWFANHPTIKEVLITGGDPLILRDKMIEYIVEKLAALDHIISIRIGTRVLVTVPQRITDELAEMLGSYIEPGKRNFSISTHVESAYEVTPSTAAAVDRLRKYGINVYNQQVYTFWVSRRFENVKFRMVLRKVGIEPYYEFYPKGKEETEDYHVPIARLMQERKEEARLLPGIFRTEEPVFNVPRMGKNHIMRAQDHELIAIRPDNGRRVYLWHPWEKNITKVKSFVYSELISIGEYLRKLAEIFKEDPEDYKSIWYYY